jgi:hypothetical protein
MLANETMNTLFQPLIVSIGAATTAIIAGLFSYLALVIAKEHKTSEFRQAWVDALREEVADLIASARIICYKVVNLEERYGDRANIPVAEVTNAICEPYEKASIAYNRILLRLNPKNENSAALIKALNQVDDATRKGEFERLLDDLRPVRENAQAVLKEEWERVKKGEKVYVWSKRVLGALMAIGLLGLVGLALFSIVQRTSPSTVTPAKCEKMANQTPNHSIEPTPKVVPSPAAQEPHQP